MKDQQFLSERFKLRSVIRSWLKAAPALLVNVFWADVFFCWFATMSAALLVLVGRVLGKPTLIVIGGIDVASLPEINYGAFVNPARARIGRFALKHASRLLVVDPSLTADITRRVGRELDNVRYVPTGYDFNVFKPAGAKERGVLTVAWCPDATRLRLKGIDTFVETARRLPGLQFWVVGIESTARRHLERAGLPKNLTVVGPLPHRQLIAYYQRAAVYCQLSMREGLPNALCEAMLCGCVPVGTNRGGIPTAIGRTGLYVDYGDPTATARAIVRALATSNRFRTAARQRIIKSFPLKVRQDRLLAIISELSGRA
jgi:glycosyltransferase involved in cell wall biosynthesis